MDIISMRDFNKEDILCVLKAATEVKRAIHDTDYNHQVFQPKHGRSVGQLLEGKMAANLFVENSTRTNHSTRAAVMRAGGRFDGFSSADDTSLRKGETWADTTAMFAGYGYDALVMRSTTEGLPRWTKEFLEANNQQMSQQHQVFGLPYHYRVPLIVNGGDGKNQHPTQCFLDLLTMQEIAKAEGRSLEGLNLALLNDLAHGRTNASLMSVAHHFGWKLHLAYPPRFGPRAEILEDLRRSGVEVHDYGDNFLEAMRHSFIAYHSRPQKERVGKGEDLEVIKAKGQITPKMYDRLGPSSPYLMHPLPIDSETFEEIAAEMRFHPKNVTRYQSANGLYIRIALLALNLGRMEGLPHSDDLEARITEGQLAELPLSLRQKELSNSMSGFIIGDGVVLDHIPAGMGRRLAGILGLEREQVPKVISDHMAVRDQQKDMIKIHGGYELSPQQYEALALVSPDVTISYVQGGKVVRKVRPIVGDRITDRVNCGNEACVTNVRKEHVTPWHLVEKVSSPEGSAQRTILRCGYCERPDTIQQIYEQQRFRYIQKG